VHPVAEPSVDAAKLKKVVEQAQKPIVPQQEQQKAQQEVQKEEAPPVSDAPAHMTAAALPSNVVSREEKVEYRDQDGNLLDPEEVKKMAGKVSFKTRYETRTRMVDQYGNEVYHQDAPPVEKVEEQQPVAPPHPDVEGSDPETVGEPEVESVAAPASQAKIAEDEANEAAIPEHNKEEAEAKPASDTVDATA
jgi:dolichyl-phosphate-mannose-protein mannosyltransferase